MRIFLLTVLRFLGFGFLLGGSLGLLFGTLAVPLYGTIIGVLWGSASGIILGLLLGILLGVLNSTFLRLSPSIPKYRQRLTNGIWLGTTFLGAFVVTPIFSPVAGFAAAYTANYYADWYIGQIRKTTKEGAIQRQPPYSDFAVALRIVGEFMRGSPLILLLVFIIIFIVRGLTIAFDGIAIYILLWSMLVVLPSVSIANACSIVCLNRIYFNEYYPHKSPRWYKNRIAVISVLFTLVISVIVGVGIGIFPAAWVTWFAVRRYANWYAAKPEKNKRKAQESAARLMDKMPEENSDSDADEVVYPMKQSQ